MNILLEQVQGRTVKPMDAVSFNQRVPLKSHDWEFLTHNSVHIPSLISLLLEEWILKQREHRVNEEKKLNNGIGAEVQE